MTPQQRKYEMMSNPNSANLDSPNPLVRNVESGRPSLSAYSRVVRNLEYEEYNVLLVALPHSPVLTVIEKNGKNGSVPSTLHLVLSTMPQCLFEDLIWAKACSWTYLSSYKHMILVEFKSWLVFIDRCCGDCSLNWFIIWKDSCRFLDLSTIQYVSSWICQLGYGHAANSTNEYNQVGVSTAIVRSKNSL